MIKDLNFSNPVLSRKRDTQQATRQTHNPDKNKQTDGGVSFVHIRKCAGTKMLFLSLPLSLSAWPSKVTRCLWRPKTFGPWTLVTIPKLWCPDSSKSGRKSRPKPGGMFLAVVAEGKVWMEDWIVRSWNVQYYLNDVRCVSVHPNNSFVNWQRIRRNQGRNWRIVKLTFLN